MGNIIFIGGVHGVGKSSLCEKISKKYNIMSLSASQLISRNTKIDYSTNKKVIDIDKNQNVLIRAISELKLDDRLLILEGHFCLLNKEGDINRIPESTFTDLGIKAIVLLTASVETIHSRLRQRGSEEKNISFLESFSKEELVYSREIAKKLNVPYIEYNEIDSNIKDLESFLESTL